MTAPDHPPYKVSDAELADWVELVLTRRSNSAESAEAYEMILESDSLLRAGERLSLLAAFDALPKDRAELVAELLESDPSPAMVRAAARLMRHGGFHGRTRLRESEVKKRQRQMTMVGTRKDVIGLMREVYQDANPTILARRATRITAILHGVRSPTVSKAIKDAKDLRRGALADLRSEVSSHPTRG